MSKIRSLNRRRFFDVLGLGIFAQSCALSFENETRTLKAETQQSSVFKTRGIVLSVAELESLNWPRLAKEANLSTIGTHITPSQVASFIGSAKGERFLHQCSELGVQVEHELHAMEDLLPRDLFAKDRNMFRMNESGDRVTDANFCAHSHDAIEIICDNAIQYARILPPSTSRYFFWMDDAKPMCRCPRCRVYSDSDQALILENAMLKALRRNDPRSTLAHLAYLNTLPAPSQVEPAPGIFLEFAPINRSWDHSLRTLEATGRDEKTTHGDLLNLLDANLGVFGSEGAQVLEYWLDVSLFSGWKKSAKVKLPWKLDVFRDDIDTYAKRGIRHITSFGVYLDADYLERFGDIGFLTAYGDGLLHYEWPIHGSQ